MGSTLEHGIYLPSEGEKNCYQGLASNWNKVDGALGDVAGLKQLIESKFTKEIVTELPTEDINPYCIYMILKTDPETNNIYDEWVYINNAWEYLGNTQVDMTQYYTKQEVNELPAVASGVTSTKVGNYDTHLADSNIHVTANDKTKWNTVALIKQLRLVNAQVGSATTIAFANIDDTNGIKVGDKCMDLDAKMFEITAVDTTNQTVTVGTALIDLALDANVVHTNKNDDVSIPLNSTSAELGVTGGSTNITFLDKNGKKLSGLTLGNYSSSKLSYARLSIWGKDTNDNEVQDNLEYAYVSNNSNAYLRVGRDNFCNLGSISARWKGVYAQSYYYGSDNVEFSTKFVTTDTAQTISGAKTFNSNTSIYNSDNSAVTPNLYLRSSKIEISSQGNTSGDQNLAYTDKNNTVYAYIKGAIQSNGSLVKIRAFCKDGSDNSVINELQIIANTNGKKIIFPSYTNDIELGSSSYRWKDVNTYLVNGLTPSSLSLPGYTTSRLDISGYITDLTGGNNNYTVPANGYIFVRSLNSTYIKLLDYPSEVCSCVCSQTADDIGTFLPVIANRMCIISIKCSSIDRAYFIPCQGNV